MPVMPIAEQPAVREDRRRLRSGTVGLGCAVHLERRRVGGAPQYLPARRVHGAHHLVVTLPREHVDTIADDKRGRVAGPDVDLPALRQLFRARWPAA